MNRLKILLIIGHGGNDKGATGNGMYEVDVNYTMAWAMYNYLKPYADVTIETNNQPLNGEVALVKAGNYDIVISIHNNAGGGDGWEGFHYRGDAKAIALLKSIEKEVIAIGQQSRGVKDGSGFLIINGVAPTSIILEGFFLDNAKDAEGFNEKWEQERMGQAYAKGVLNWMGVTHSPIIPPSSNRLYRVICGSYKDRANASRQSDALRAKGFDSFIEVK